MTGVFISYSSHNKPLALQLADDLKDAGMNVWLDEWEIQVGDDIRRKVEHGISNYDYFAVILTCAAVKSEWVQRELTAAFSKEIINSNISILPILAEECEIPCMLWGRKYADFTKEYKDGLEQLLGVLRPQLSLDRLSFNELVRAKNKTKGKAAFVVLTDGTTCCGIVGGISESRKTLGLERIGPREWQEMWFEIGPERIAAVYHCNIKYDEECEEAKAFQIDSDAMVAVHYIIFQAGAFHEFDKWEFWKDFFKDRLPEDAKTWMLAEGYRPYNFCDTMNARLRQLCDKEGFGVLFGRDLAAMGYTSAKRYRRLRIKTPFILYCDWLSNPNISKLLKLSLPKINVPKIFEEFTRETTPQKSFSSSLFEMAGDGETVVLQVMIEKLDTEIYRMDADDWIWAKVRIVGTTGKSPNWNFICPVAFRWKGLAIPPSAFKWLANEFSIVAEVTHRRLDTPFGKIDKYLKCSIASVLENI